MKTCIKPTDKRGGSASQRWQVLQLPTEAAYTTSLMTFRWLNLSKYIPTRKAAHILKVETVTSGRLTLNKIHKNVICINKTLLLLNIFILLKAGRCSLLVTAQSGPSNYTVNLNFTVTSEWRWTYLILYLHFFLTAPVGGWATIHFLHLKS